ncbi:MAG: RidA family protein [Gemmatimonadetes bacterium]|nr:RidA family protein [Gemmatimonadota bacterium]
MRLIETSRAPIPKGHYSQAVVHGGLVYVAGQLPGDPADPDGGYPASVGEQTERVLSNIQAILEDSGSGLDRVLQMTVFVSDPGYWGEVNAAYGRVMGSHRPARAIVPVNELNGAALEVQVIAAVG